MSLVQFRCDSCSSVDSSGSLEKTQAETHLPQALGMDMGIAELM